MRVLLVEDDEDLGRAVVCALEEEGFGVHWEKGGSEGLYRAKEWDYDLIILDRMLPGLDGIGVLKQLRIRKRMPVLMLTALNTLQNRLEGLDGGADDYLGKPFELPELFARIRALLRRSSDWNEVGLEHRDVRLDPVAQKVYKGGAEVGLTASELDTVELLMSRKGKLVAKRILEDRLHEDSAEYQSNSLEVHIFRIRSKLGKDFIQTRRGLGYMIGGDEEGAS